MGVSFPVSSCGRSSLIGQPQGMVKTKQRPGSFRSRANFRFGLTAHSHGQVTSGRASDEGLCSKMDFVILIVRLATWKCQGLLLLDQAIQLDRGVVDMTAIHTTPTGRPHLSI